MMINDIDSYKSFAVPKVSKMMNDFDDGDNDFIFVEEGPLPDDFWLFFEEYLSSPSTITSIYSPKYYNSIIKGYKFSRIFFNPNLAVPIILSQTWFLFQNSCLLTALRYSSSPCSSAVIKGISITGRLYNASFI